jgi:hypothetical protein
VDRAAPAGEAKMVSKFEGRSRFSKKLLPSFSNQQFAGRTPSNRRRQTPKKSRSTWVTSILAKSICWCGRAFIPIGQISSARLFAISSSGTRTSSKRQPHVKAWISACRTIRALASKRFSELDKLSKSMCLVLPSSLRMSHLNLLKQRSVQ